LTHRHLYRSTKDKKIAGIAGGLADYLNIDSTLVRLLWLLSIFIGGSGVLVYIIAWITIPEEKAAIFENDLQPEKDEIDELIEGNRDTGNREKVEKQKKFSYIGLILIVIGVFFLFREFFPWRLARYTWPFILITLGIFLLVPLRGHSS
jgi:phage shock protein C